MIEWVVQTVSSSSVGALFLILLTGLLLGQMRLFGLNLGSAGVLFTALLAGHYKLVVPEFYGSLGVIFFVYAVGLQAGPRFIHTIRTSGASLIRVCLVIIGAGAVAALVMGRLFSLEPGIVVGAFAGAMTSTPALAAGLEVFRTSSSAQLALAAVSYGLAYPIGVIGAVLPVQLLPKLLKKHVKQPSAEREGDPSGAITTAAFRVENPNIVGRTVEGVNLWDFARISLSRILHEGEVHVVLGSTVLREGDEVLAVGRPDDLAKLELVIGSRIDSTPLFEQGDRTLEARDIFVGTRATKGRSTASLSARYGVSLTRVVRLGIALAPGRDMALEPGDRIRAVGEPNQLEELEQALGHREQSIFETDMLGLVSGILAGVILGLIPWPISGAIGSLKLGLAGGPLFVSILAGHYGKIGPISNRIPASARFLLRELGLVLFLAYAGSKAGVNFVETFRQSGVAVLVTSLVIVLVPVALGFVTAFVVYRYDLTFSLGLICGGMTSTPALGTLISSLKTQEPAIAYAAIYPIALIAVTATAQVMALLL